MYNECICEKVLQNGHILSLYTVILKMCLFHIIFRLYFHLSIAIFWRIGYNCDHIAMYRNLFHCFFLKLRLICYVFERCCRCIYLRLFLRKRAIIWIQTNQRWLSQGFSPGITLLHPVQPLTCDSMKVGQLQYLSIQLFNTFNCNVNYILGSE